MEKKITLDSFIEALAAMDGVDCNSIVIYKDGKIAANYDWKEVKRTQMHSITKSFTSTATGFAVNEGLFSLEDYVLDYFREEAPQTPSPLLEEMKIKHLLTMTMGFKTPMLMGKQRPELVKTHKDWIRLALETEMVHRPGVRFMYNNIGPYLLSVLIQRKAGVSLVEYLTPRLFTPLGIAPIGDIYRCPRGYDFGAFGLELNAYELAAFGQLYLQDGIWEGKRILPEGWAKEAGSFKTNASCATADNELGWTYGYLFWLGPKEAWFAAIGAFEQICMILPDQNAVISFTGHVLNADETENSEGRPVQHAILKHLVPQLI